ncbi:hypothetical protein [Ruegeria profundi]|uniref:hypothetical protein n=1 Tax=Ruegeria profundi TaxID=1685378 RepID=UPI0009E7FA37
MRPEQNILQLEEAPELEGIFSRVMVGLAAYHVEEKTVMDDPIYLIAYRMATTMGLENGGVDARSVEPRVVEKAARYLRRPR